MRGKLDDGQLDNAPLTLRDITRICDAFATVLNGVFHERIEYPAISPAAAAHVAAQARLTEAAESPVEERELRRIRPEDGEAQGAEADTGAETQPGGGAEADMGTEAHPADGAEAEAQPGDDAASEAAAESGADGAASEAAGDSAAESPASAGEVSPASDKSGEETEK